ncbi:hypothetical protein [Embleya sp. NBC_00896]|uniref:hypothetical protein n=1 Tax=Embleya sp. NBC_00896 TaxID=2975961 RepID=UPI003868DED3|nr:hypothetical protein OG928_32375 [Embleya sp. NBC_00896]
MSSSKHAAPTPAPGRSRRALLTAALAVPATAAVTAVGMSLAEPAEAASGGIEVRRGWTTIKLAPGVTVLDRNVPQARLLDIAGSTFLQLRGTVGCTFRQDQKLGDVNPALRPSAAVRGVAPRNNHSGVNACRVDVTETGLVVVYGGTNDSPVTWIQLDDFSAMWR